MNILRSVMIALLCLTGARSMAESPWSTGHTLSDVIGYDLQSHETGQKLTDYQTNSVCLLLGYFRGFAESSAVAAHYNATALPFFLPDSITNDEIERIVYKYLSDNPGKLDLTGDALLVSALTKAFPNTVFTPPPAPARKLLPQ